MAYKLGHMVTCTAGVTKIIAVLFTGHCCCHGIAAVALITWNSICAHFNCITLLIYHLTLKIADQILI